MKRFPFKKIDAFATEKSDGNPAACIWLNKLNDLSDKEMLQTAKELKGFVSEVGYIVQDGETEFTFRYYSSERELDFCGHVTIASMYDILKNNKPSNQKYLINTNRGSLEVENRLENENAVFTMAPEPIENKNVPAGFKIAENLNIKESEISTDFPVSIINAGLETLIVPIVSLDSILGIAPDLNELNSFCVESGIDIILVFTPDVYDDANNYRTRVFAPTFGYIEDPATGSGNSAFGYYLISNDLWNKETIIIEQNGKKEQYNVVKLQQKPDSNNSPRIYFGGGAITRIEGEYLVY